jgi:NAD(P)-dependent dehydrogenase (short-subunit alcohol dehydrogenase family)
VSTTRWCEPTADWAGAGIALNAVAPGIIRTGATATGLDDGAVRERWDRLVPMPLGGAPGRAEDVASLLCRLTSPENALVTGQVVFPDGGSNAVLRADDPWSSGSRIRPSRS